MPLIDGNLVLCFLFGTNCYLGFGDFGMQQMIRSNCQGSPWVGEWAVGFLKVEQSERRLRPFWRTLKSHNCDIFCFSHAKRIVRTSWISSLLLPKPTFAVPSPQAEYLWFWLTRRGLRAANLCSRVIGLWFVVLAPSSFFLRWISFDHSMKVGKFRCPLRILAWHLAFQCWPAAPISNGLEPLSSSRFKHFTHVSPSKHHSFLIVSWL